MGVALDIGVPNVPSAGSVSSSLVASGWISSSLCFREWKGKRLLVSQLSTAATTGTPTNGAVAAVGVRAETGVEGYCVGA